MHAESLDAAAVQPTETKSGARGWTGVAVLTVLALVLVVLIVFPGFMAAWFSRSSVRFVECFPGDDWKVSKHMALTVGGHPARAQALEHVESLFAEVALYPAYQIMQRSSGAKKFYEWQFHRAGGRALIFWV